MVRSVIWSVPLLGCALLALAKGEGTVPEESCTTSDWHVPEDEVRVLLIFKVFPTLQVILQASMHLRTSIFFFVCDKAVQQ